VKVSYQALKGFAVAGQTKSVADPDASPQQGGIQALQGSATQWPGEG
jgi:hypothetical protein